jgi:hypothetical protein
MPRKEPLQNSTKDATKSRPTQMLAYPTKLLFIHIPKTGGNSVKKTLGIRTTHHQITTFPLDSRKECFTFCFVRNPWDRLVSSFHYFLQYPRNKPHNPNSELTKKTCADFTEFCRFLRRTPVEDKIIPDSRMHYGAQMKPQCFWIRNENGEIDIDFIGRYERINEDFQELCRRAQVDPVQLCHINHSEHRPYYEYYTKETREIVAEMYREDIEEFGYSFPLTCDNHILPRDG